ncbi:MAG: VOC family protein [Acidobacteriota bacterium]
MHPIVFFDIAGSDTSALQAFYASVFGWTADDQGQINVPALTPISGAFREDPPEMRLYLGVPDVTEALESIVTHGGSVDAPRFEVPGVVILGLFRDPAGNPMGLVEMDGETHKIP